MIEFNGRQLVLPTDTNGDFDEFLRKRWLKLSPEEKRLCKQRMAIYFASHNPTVGCYRMVGISRHDQKDIFASHEFHVMLEEVREQIKSGEIDEIELVESDNVWFEKGMQNFDYTKLEGIESDKTADSYDLEGLITKFLLTKTDNMGLEDWNNECDILMEIALREHKIALAVDLWKAKGKSKGYLQEGATINFNLNQKAQQEALDRSAEEQLKKIEYMNSKIDDAEVIDG